MTRVEDNLNNKTGNYIFPFFWQNGADEQTLQTELLKIYESNILIMQAKDGGMIWISLWILPALMI